MGNKKISLGQFYTKNSIYIIGNLINDIDKSLTVVEPFCGEGDLLIVENPIEIYDIDPKISSCVKRDTLLNPPNYDGKLVITNPPFLAKNKNKDKTIYNLYDVSDLYKAAIKTILNCSGGILITPLNFLCDEDSSIRNLFFDKFEIITLNIFEERVFDDTSYTICSFSFKKRVNFKMDDDIKCVFYPSKEIFNLNISKSTSWRVGSDFIKLIDSIVNIGLKRLTKNDTPNSNLFLRATDSGGSDGRISLCINKTPFYGKDTDRTFASIITTTNYTDKEQELICSEFNEIIELYREKYKSLFLTNYRTSTKSYARKRISFDVAYKLISYIIKKNNLPI